VPGYGAPGYGAPGYGFDGPRSEGLAVAALVVAIVGVFVCGVFAGIVALVLASQAQRKIAASGGRLTGTGMVTAARVVAVVAIALNLIFIAAYVAMN
jgi:putative exporter of polyketide antibiotics